VQLVTSISFQRLSSQFLNELTDGVHDILREFIPCVDHSLAEEVFSDIQV